MKIIECCPFYNEDELCGIKYTEGANWIDELHVSECNMTFKCDPKPYNLQHEGVIHKKLVGENNFIKNYYGIRRKYPFFGSKPGAWRNEATQRNAACANLDLDDDDIVILSDIDEIIDSRYAEQLVVAVKKHKIVTVKLHFTLFYLNLFSTNWHEVWPGSPEDYSYRVFLIQGDYFKKHKINSNKLRRLGEGGHLCNEVYCFPEIAGYHHSWLGDYKAAVKKMESYAHEVKDHGSEMQNTDDVEIFIKNKIANQESIFEGHNLEVRAKCDMEFLESVVSNGNYDKYFL